MPRECKLIIKNLLVIRRWFDIACENRIYLGDGGGDAGSTLELDEKKCVYKHRDSIQQQSVTRAKRS